jgi:tRNA(fMet)-specific endonuclease VapC
LRYLLDTNMVSALMRGDPHVAARVAGTPREDVAISQVTASEIEFGLRHLPASRRRRAMEAQWAAIGAELIRIPWSDEVSRRFGERKARLARAGRRMSDFDLAIAVHALAYGLIIVTADRAFERLKVARENWLL